MQFWGSRSCWLATVTIATALIVSSGGEAAAQKMKKRRGAVIQSPVTKVHKKGEYGGVHPGKKVTTSYKKKRPWKNKRRGKRPAVTWVGFQPKSGGGSRLFVQLTREVEFSQRLDGETLIVSLPGARLGSRNARRALDMRFFETSLRRAKAKRVRRSRRAGRAAGVEIRISFKSKRDAAEASANMSENERDGYYYLFLEFGAPSPEPDGDDEGGDDEDDDGGGELTDVE